MNNSVVSYCRAAQHVIAAADGGPAHSMPQIQNAAGSAPRFSSWSGSLPAAVLDVQEAEQKQTGKQHCPATLHTLMASLTVCCAGCAC